jgi:cysteinyl-tRNA synthetase
MQPGQEFEEALDDDLNISAALGFLFEKIRETNRALDRNELDAASANGWLNWWERVNSVLAVEEEIAPLPQEIAKLAEARAQARLAKDWRKSDELRDELSARGWEARDTKDGQKVTRRAGG